MNKKLLIVGWDGAPYNLINEYLKKGELKTLEKISNRGFFGPLRTTPFVMSPCAWSTMVTGKNAGKHGIFDFFREFEGNSYFRAPITAKDRDEKEFWHILKKNSFKVGLVNIPITYPFEDLKGIGIPGILTPSKDKIKYPLPDDYIIDVEESGGTDKEKFLKNVEKMIEKRTELILKVAEEDIDVLFAVYVAPDRLSHFFFEDKETLLKIYKKLDDDLGKIIDIFNPNSIVVVSDHGMEKIEKNFHVNKWLEEKGFLKFKPKDQWNWSNKEKLDSQVEYIYGKVDWSKTKAYSIGKRGAIYINLKGREPSGIVEKRDYYDLVKRLKKELEEMPEVKMAYIRDEVFFGRNLYKSPDIILRMKKGTYPLGYAYEVDKTFTKNITSFESIEDGDGIFLVKDENVVNDSFSGANIIDVAPTILSLLGAEVPKDMDGRVFNEIFESKNKGKNIKSTPNDEIRRRLRKLGYT